MFRKKRSNSSIVRRLASSPFADMLTSTKRQPPTSVPQTTPSAATAAAQAFLKKQADESTLSNAAAAAALRSHATSPTPVGDIQTKRMVRRGSTSSIGSIGSNNAAARQPFSSTLQRRGSNSSMSQRSFRSPSPGHNVGAPPVPSLPDTVPPLPTKSTRRSSRASSIESSSRAPATAQAGARSGMNASSWASGDKHRASKGPAINTTIARAQAASPVDGATASSPRSINFSRPMSPSIPSSPTTDSAASLRPRPASALALTQEQLKRLREETELERLRTVSGSPSSAGKISMVYDPASRKMVRAIIQPDEPPAQAAASSAASGTQKMVFDAASRKMVPADSAGMPAIPERDYTHTASGQPARAMSLTSAQLAAVRRMQSPAGRVASPEAIALAQGKAFSPSPPTRRVASPPPSQANRMSSPPARASSMTAVPAPSADQIRAFQTRAAAMLARPTSQVAPPAPAQATQRPTSMLFKPSSTESPRASASELSTPKVPASPTAATRTVSLSSASAGPESPIQRLARNEKSASPARTPRFLESPLLEVTKHKPPPRSASPGKSAMKGHSPRNMSPAESRTRDSTAFSDAGSAISDESHTVGKKKKSVRVSFEEKPLLVGTAASTGSPTDTVLSPQFKKVLRDAGEDDFAGMGDRPALPSFGSVRGKKAPVSEEVITPEPESPTSILKPSVETVQKAAEEPADSSVVAAPEIAILPATPRVEETDSLGEGATAPATDATMSAEDIGHVAESYPDYSADVDDHPWVSTHPHDDNASDTDDDLNQFSDAAEDLEDRPGFTSLDAILESPHTEEAPAHSKTQVLAEPVMDRIAQEPIAVASTADTPMPLAATAGTVEESPVLAAESSPAEDWELVKQYWSSLSEQRRREIEAQANVSSGTIDAAAAAQEVPREPVPKPVKSALKKTEPVEDPQRLPPWPDKQYQQSIQRPAPVKRNSSESATHMRSSMRTGGTMRTSMHEAPVQKNTRANSGRPAKPDPMTNASAEAIALARQFMPKPQPKRRDSNDSDASDSSFKKRRGRNPDPRAAAYNMKRSMRDAAAAPSLRSELSPTASASGRKPLRSSVRASSIDSTVSEPKSGFFGMGKSKNKASKAKSKLKQNSSGGLGFKSRFNDSSDEDSDGGSRFNFRSRFNNSDDDDSDYEPSIALPRIPANFPTTTSSQSMPAHAPSQQREATAEAPSEKLTPVRGIPRKAGQEDAESTDLSDSDDEGNAARAPRASVPDPAKATNRPGTPPASTALDFGNKSPQSPPTAAPMNGNAAIEGKVLESGTLRSRADSSEKRRSFFSLGHNRKKSGSGSGPGAMSESKWADASPQTEPPNRPETPSRSLPKSLRSNPTKELPRSSSRNSIFHRLSLGQSNSAPSSPANQAVGKTDFPFPPPPIPEEFRTVKDRPNTSDGVSSNGTRPPFERGESTQTAPTSGADESGRRNRLSKKPDPIFSERTGKKKKFAGLRRALGLHD